MTRKRRYLISAAVLATCVCIALSIPAMLPPRPGVTKQEQERRKALLANKMPMADDRLPLK